MLSVVIPVYDEPDWIGRTVADLLVALEASPWAADTEIVIVDDGSGPATQEALARLSGPVRVIRQDNQGRFLARKTGIEAARGELVLLLDSRTSLHPDALRWVAPHVAEGRRVWNGHCMIETDGNPYARFWDVITHAALRDYLSNPRTTSFGPEEYDRFPKGTTHFLVPREYLLDALASFDTFYEDLRNANDDTALLRQVVERERINISPQFASVYRSRTNLRAFLRHVHHRGVVFVDGFGRPGTRFFPVVVAVFPATIAATWVALRRPRLALAAALASPAAAAAVPLWLRRPVADVRAFATLAPLFAVFYVAGIWKGAALALRASRRR